MKNGAVLSVVLAPGGTTMFWVTQAGCAMAMEPAIEARETNEISVPAWTENEFVISAPAAGAPCRLVLRELWRPARARSNTGRPRCSNGLRAKTGQPPLFRAWHENLRERGRCRPVARLLACSHSKRVGVAR